MRIAVVRHGHAGSKERWQGDDRLRPLSARGRRQADRLIDALAPFEFSGIVSSPYLRCQQTIEPLAHARDVPVEESDALLPDQSGAALELLRNGRRTWRRSGVVLCTHGELISVTLAVLASDEGVELGGKLPGGKGGVWVLDFAGSKLRSMDYVPSSSRAVSR